VSGGPGSPARRGAAAREELAALAGPGHAQAAAARGRLAALALEARNASAEAAGLPPLGSVEAYAAELARRTVCLTLLAGSGSRWLASLAEARGRGDPAALAFDPERPRGLFPVADYLRPPAPGSASDGPRRGSLPVAAYALAAVRGLGRHLLVVRGWEEAIDAEILAPLGIGPGEREFFTQEAPFGKPLGHGDAAWQCRSRWARADYVLANFGGDANSRRTALASLLVLDALSGPGGGGPAGAVDLLVPAAPVRLPAYPIELDAGGLPSSFGQAKLQGRKVEVEAGYTNVGIRVYRAGALLEKVESIRRRFWAEGSGYAIPGNDPAGREFALDNVDAELAAEGRARILAAARPEELTPAKNYGDIPAFEAAMARVAAEAGGAPD